jgi:hypothetical protein
MNKPKDHRAKPPQGQAAEPKSPDTEKAAQLSEYIGQELRSMFDDIVSEPVPERFRELLEELQKKRPKA